jgi:hypothetical protein
MEAMPKSIVVGGTLQATLILGRRGPIGEEADGRDREDLMRYPETPVRLEWLPERSARS